MNGVVSQVRLDNARMMSYGRFRGNLLLVYLAPLMALVMGLIGDKTEETASGILGGICGGLSPLTIIYCVWPFMLTEQYGDSRIDGMIPISRMQQVVGRYIMAGCTILADAVGLALAVPVLKMIGSPVPPRLWQFDGLLLLVVSLLVLIAMPFFYRYSTMTMMKGMAIAIVGIAVLYLLLSRLPVDWMHMLSTITAFLSASAVRTVLLAVPIAVACVALSILASDRMYGSKEL
ncbi:ABC-2 transporter permease [Bifidobacterium xylocopae]|uniref:ABC-2 transporter permease n=1 Tax=Bifidobacterium xylocopae TaxID=2493119 RepID=A0A366KD70_9BIFI|nr:ABC-2 transporter permease [Bifidobacterium xylocopae]RBP99519.1 hypothetical protein CRD59_03040 [Bifidobacterium xylocopae]